MYSKSRRKFYFSDTLLYAYSQKINPMVTHEWYDTYGMYPIE